MKMFRYFILFIALVGFIGCDKIGDEKLRDNTNPDPDPVPTKFVRKVLVEEFVGHKGKKCPTADLVINDLRKEYDDKVIPIAIHGGVDAMIGGSYVVDYTTEFGSSMFQEYAVSSVPLALIGRSTGGKLFKTEEFAEEVKKELSAVVPKVKLEIVPSYDKANGEVGAKVTATFLEAVKNTDEFKLNVCLTESKLKSIQQNDNPEIGDAFMTDYEHNYVLRGTMNESGEKLPIPVNADKPYEFSYDNLPLKKEWNAENMRIVAYVSNTLTKEVIQAEEIKLTASVKPDPDPDPNPDPDPKPEKVKRKILLEEFTGHACVNCPKAHKMLAEMLETYKENIVSVAIHAGWFAKVTNSQPTDFNTSEGTEIHNTFKVSAVPVAMINRVGNGSLFNSDSWESEVRRQMNQDAKVSIKITPTYDEAGAKIKAHLEVKFLENVTEKYNLCVLAIESGIISPQKNNDSDIGPDILPNYKHKHVLRGMFNGTWGKLIESPEANKIYTFDYDDFGVRGDWNAENMSVVAFIYNQETKEVIQVEEVHLH